MTESLPPDADGQPAADAAEPSITSSDAEFPDFVPTEPVVPMSPPPATAPPGRGPAVALGHVAAALVGALLLGGSLVAFGVVGRAAPSPSPSPSPAPSATLAPTPTPPPIAADGPSLGSAAAPVTIEVWADFQCPFCKLLAMAFGGSMERAYVLPGIARIVSRDFAFLGQESIDAAVAARCAGAQDPGAYWRYHDLLFASQEGENKGTFKRQNLATLARVAGVDPTPFTACLDDPAVAEAVAAETAQGRALGIDSTPTLRISGPGGTRILAGFGAGWSTIRDAIAAVSAPAPGVSPEPSGSTPIESGAPSTSP
jgi:protein-disulfide isomerase